MITIGINRIRAMRKRDKTSGKLLAIFGADDKPLTKIVSDEVWRVTRGTLTGRYGRDRDRKLVVGFVQGDLLALRPQGTRQQVEVDLMEVYQWVLHRKATTAHMLKLRERKAQRVAQRASRKVAYYDKRLHKIVIPKNPLSPVDPNKAKGW